MVVDGEGGTTTLSDLEGVDPGFDPSPIADAIEPDDLLTLIYTSGTTGRRRASSSRTATCSRWCRASRT